MMGTGGLTAAGALTGTGRREIKAAMGMGS